MPLNYSSTRRYVPHAVLLFSHSSSYYKSYRLGKIIVGYACDKSWQQEESGGYKEFHSLNRNNCNEARAIVKLCQKNTIRLPNKFRVKLYEDRLSQPYPLLFYSRLFPGGVFGGFFCDVFYVVSRLLVFAHVLLWPLLLYLSYFVQLTFVRRFSRWMAVLTLSI